MNSCADDGLLRQPLVHVVASWVGFNVWVVRP
jgi:hypothetical protein